MKNTTESVTGKIIGGDYFQATLIQPSGNPFGNPKCFESVDESLTWARTARADALDQMGSFGKFLDINKPWILRITGCPDLSVE